MLIFFFVFLLAREFISYRSLLYPILLSEGVYSTLFVLYANKCSKRDEIYRQRIIFSEKKSDIELMEHLKITMLVNNFAIFVINISNEMVFFKKICLQGPYTIDKT